MADLKISDMTPATEVANADIVPIVAGLANFSATRELLLTAANGEDILLMSDGTNKAGMQGNNIATIIYVQADDAAMSAGDTLLITAPTAGSASSIFFSSTGAVFKFPNDQGLLIEDFSGSGGTFVFTGSSNSIAVTGWASVQIQCDVITGAAWAFAPTFYTDAIDRLAVAVAGLLGFPVP